MNTLIKTIEYFLFITAELTVLFIGISAIVALVLMYIPKEKLKSWVSKCGLWGNVLGALFGTLTPFCACSTVPVTLGLLNAGAPFGPIMSFVISSPLLDPLILSMIAAMIGLKACLLYFAVTFFGSIIFGVILEKTGGAKYVKDIRVKQSCCCSKENEIPADFWGKVKVSLKSAWKDYTAVLIYLLIGVGVGAGIYGYMPQDFVAKIAGPQNHFAIPIAALIGIPLYIRAESAIPIGLALAQKGMSMGAVMALIIGGAGMAIPEMVMLASIFKKRLVASIVAVVFATAVIGGYLFNVFVQVK